MILEYRHVHQLIQQTKDQAKARKQSDIEWYIALINIANEK